jgi:hypothetical protein
LAVVAGIYIGMSASSPVTASLRVSIPVAAQERQPEPSLVQPTDHEGSQSRDGRRYRNAPNPGIDIAVHRRGTQLWWEARVWTAIGTLIFGALFASILLLIYTGDGDRIRT